MLPAANIPVYLEIRLPESREISGLVTAPGLGRASLSSERLRLTLQASCPGLSGLFVLLFCFPEMLLQWKIYSHLEESGKGYKRKVESTSGDLRAVRVKCLKNGLLNQ